MKAVVQRVLQASVSVDGLQAGSIGAGLLVLVGYERGDSSAVNEWLSAKLTQMRIFADEQGKMNNSVQDIGGGLLIVSNFTLCAATAKGNRPGFADAEEPSKAQELYEHLLQLLNQTGIHTQAGIFGADMKVSLTNDGPVTLILERKC
jgi:D-tyrosyl-tRNA(Tyr) deacylase